MSTLTSDRIRETATKLGLTHIAEVLTQLVDRAEDADMGYLDLIDLLLEEELGQREGRRFRNALNVSGLPHHKTLDDFDFAFQPDLDARKVRDLATLEFARTKSNIVLLGPPGVGKTMLAVALAIAACQAGFSIYYTTLDDLVRRLRTAEAAGRFNRQLAAYLRPAVLVVDLCRSRNYADYSAGGAGSICGLGLWAGRLRSGRHSSVGGMTLRVEQGAPDRRSCHGVVEAEAWGAGSPCRGVPVVPAGAGLHPEHGPGSDEGSGAPGSLDGTPRSGSCGPFGGVDRRLPC